MNVFILQVAELASHHITCYLGRIFNIDWIFWILKVNQDLCMWMELN